MKTVALVAAAGIGQRMGSARPKTLLEIGQKPILAWTLRAFQAHPQIDGIVLVFQPDSLKTARDIVRRYRFSKVSAIVAGGATRQASVKNGLGAVEATADFVAIHDGARPCVDEASITRVLAAAKRSGAAVLGVPVKPTIKSVDRRGLIQKTLLREGLWEIQTPQVFRRALIADAYRRYGSRRVSDDASLVEHLGHKVAVVLGSYFNIKVTTPEDMVLARAILRVSTSGKARC
jgi:2-C-methyl-D-erythritol 4-phosphate cytidylyltransferase